jgi:hypothetical protein
VVLRRTLISFDIDGTLVAGDPPGPVTFDMVWAAKSRGYVIGSSSDRTIREQRAIWQLAEIEVDFVCNKHRMAETVAAFECATKLHVGDTSSDEYYARLAGFDFYDVADLQVGVFESWLDALQ